MSNIKKRQLERYQRIRKRQPSSAYAPQYEAAIKATREEAPKDSRPTRINPPNRLGRVLHASSLAERAAILVALYHPSVFDLREQFVLQPGPSSHPLTGHPNTVGMDLPDLPGMVAIYDQLGAIDAYPVLNIDLGSGITPVPDLLVGDLLLAITDNQGPYCVNWSVKKTFEGFKMPFDYSGSRNPEKTKSKFQTRNEAEELYYKAAGINTKEVAEEMFSDQLIENLCDCYCWGHKEKTKWSNKSEVSALINRYIFSESIHEIAKICAIRWGVDPDQTKALAYGKVFRRELRVEIHDSRLYLDRPWKPERTDVLVKYSRLFER